MQEQNQQQPQPDQKPDQAPLNAQNAEHPAKVKRKGKKRGPAPLAPELKRLNRLNVFFSDAEYAQLLTHVKKKSGLSSYVRLQAVAGKKKPFVNVPDINLKAYEELARAASNLNQIAKNINSGNIPEINLIQNELHAFRISLIKQKRV